MSKYPEHIDQGAGVGVALGWCRLDVSQELKVLFSVWGCGCDQGFVFCLARLGVRATWQQNRKEKIITKHKKRREWRKTKIYTRIPFNFWTSWILGLINPVPPIVIQQMLFPVHSGTKCFFRSQVYTVPGALSTGAKRLGHKDDQSPLSCDDIKNSWSYTPTPPISTDKNSFKFAIQSLIPWVYIVQRKLWQCLCIRYTFFQVSR